MVPSRLRLSVMTINRGRDNHLARLLEGLSRGVAPDEVIVVEMGAFGPVETRGGILRVPLPGTGLPLARARNAGRRAATGDVLLFLDVDCIPSADLIAAVSARVPDALVCYEVLYLRDQVSDDWNERMLVGASVAHPARRFPATGTVEALQPGLFWSLAFSVSADTFDRLGGFDEDFTGYGAEDTDLAYRAASAEVPVLFSGEGKAFHQRHDSYDPPLNHCADIVRNAVLFKRRHGVWPMKGWLDAFHGMGLIRIRGDAIEILRGPTSAEMRNARVPFKRAF